MIAIGLGPIGDGEFQDDVGADPPGIADDEGSTDGAFQLLAFPDEAGAQKMRAGAKGMGDASDARAGHG
jgi:hypothetical protein